MNVFDVGFLGTKAPFYLDFVGLFFIMLPFLMAISILFAINSNIKAHLRSQLFLFITTLIMVVIFEVGMRLSGGFISYMKESSISLEFMTIFLIIHIIIALMSVVLWAYQLISSMKAYSNAAMAPTFGSRHKKIGQMVFVGMLITSIMGSCIYYFLFMM